MAQAAEDGRGAVHEAGKDPGEVVTVGKAAEFRDLLDRAVAVMQQPAGAFDAEPPGKLLRGFAALVAEQPDETLAVQPGDSGEFGVAGRIGGAFFDDLPGRGRSAGPDSGARRSAPGGSLSSAASSSDSAMNARRNAAPGSGSSAGTPPSPPAIRRKAGCGGCAAPACSAGPAD